MNELEKLKHLLHHWKEHNDEHAETYRQWAEKASLMGNKDLAGALECLYRKTKELDTCFDKALKAMI
jgi:hypothetical protein